MIVLAVAASAIALAAQSNLPRLALDSYPAAARADIERAAALARSHPDDDQAVGGLARTLHAWEQWDAAHEAYTLASRLAPRRPDWPYLDAVVLQRLARPAEAVTRLRAALAIAPGDLPARLRLAETLLDAGELDASEQAFAALTEPAVEPAVQFGLGRIAAQRGQPSAAIPHLERAIKLFPEFGAAHYALARAYRAIGRTEDAQHEIDMHTRYGAAWPAVPDPILDAVRTSRQDAGALIQRGTRLADGGNVEGAIAAHEEALARDPSLAQAHANLIALYGRIHNWSKGEEHYRALIALGANGADPQYDYGVLLGLQEKWTAAAEAYRQALAFNPHHAQAHNNLGQILERQRDIAAAADEYRLAVASEPTLRVARFNLGRMLVAQGRLDAAITELTQLSEPRDAETPRYLYALAATHIRAGHRADGLTWAGEARELALHYGQIDLAAAIERDLAAIR